MCLGLGFHTSTFSVAVMQTQEAGAGLNSLSGELIMVCPRADPEQVLEKEPAELRVWLGSPALHAQGPGSDSQHSKVNKNPNKNETEGKKILAFPDSVLGSSR